MSQCSKNVSKYFLGNSTSNLFTKAIHASLVIVHHEFHVQCQICFFLSQILYWKDNNGIHLFYHLKMHVWNMCLHFKQDSLKIPCNSLIKNGSFLVIYIEPFYSKISGQSCLHTNSLPYFFLQKIMLEG